MLWAALFFAILFGVMLMISLTGRRRGSGLFCAGCGQGLDGVEVAMCPECGASLNSPRSAVRGGRQRRIGLVFVSVLGLAISAPAALFLVDQAFVNSGWERQAPAWWLTDVEMRYASGGRLDVVCGAICGAGKSRFSKSQVGRAETIAFERLLAEDAPQSVGQMHSPYFYQMAIRGASQNDEALARLTRQHTVVTSPNTPLKRGWKPTSVPTPSCNFLPAGWKINSKYIVKDAQGNTVEGFGASPFPVISLGNGRWRGGQPGPLGPAPHYVVWYFELRNPKSDPQRIWRWSASYEVQVEESR